MHVENMLIATVHDTENLTFSEEFHGCSAQTPADSCAERRGSSAGRLRIFGTGGHEFWKWRKLEGELCAQGSFELSL